MSEKTTTFGKIISEARKKKGMNLRECATLILKEDGSPISFQYLNDIENNRRNPPSEHIIEQIASILAIPVEVLYYYAGILPKTTIKDISPDLIVTAYRTFSEILSQKPQI